MKRRDRNEAIEHLKIVLKTCDVQDEEAVEMAIEALSCSEIPNNSDTISRQAVKDIFTELYGISAIGSVFDKDEWADICETTANELPSVQPERKTGKWIDAVIPNDNGDLLIQVCDQCNTFFPLAYTGGGHHFCPNCGADMKGEVNGQK